MPTELPFEDERAARPRRDKASALQEVSQTVRTLCSLSSEPKTVCSSQAQILGGDCVAIKTVPISVLGWLPGITSIPSTGVPAQRFEPAPTQDALGGSFL